MEYSKTDTIVFRIFMLLFLTGTLLTLIGNPLLIFILLFATFGFILNFEFIPTALGIWIALILEYIILSFLDNKIKVAKELKLLAIIIVFFITLITNINP